MCFCYIYIMTVFSDYIFCNLAETVNEVKANNIAFLQGKLKSCYSSMGLHDETDPIIEKIIEINRLGFITTNSQPGVYDKVEDYYQRCYISGIVYKSKYKQLQRLMRLINTDFKVIRTIKTIKELIPYYNDKLNAPPEWHIISKDSVEIYTHTIYTATFTECDDFARCRAYPELQKEFYTVEIIDLKWGRTDYMLDCLIEVLKHINTN